MESQPQNPEFRINPDNFTHACMFRFLSTQLADTFDMPKCSWSIV